MSTVELSYRTYYGKLFASLIKYFGAAYVNQIEDAIQNAFYHSLKSWKPDRMPENKENWLYIVARNDVLNQLKKEKNKPTVTALLSTDVEDNLNQQDSRLQTILYLAHFTTISTQAKALFILKNIFGLQVKEISQTTPLSEEAIYKSLLRAKKSFQLGWDNNYFQNIFEITGGNELNLIEEILYAVFNIGFDSLSEKSQSIINDDLCLESLALARLMLKKYERASTSNLIALFCFHVARIPSKIDAGQLVSFYEQDRKEWNTEMMDLGFHHLAKPYQLNKYYLEAVIASKYMITTEYNQAHWDSVIVLYQLLIKLTNSPIAKLNLCYCYQKANQITDALDLLEVVEEELPKEHIYFSLVKAHIIKASDGASSDELVSNVINNITQTIRREYLLKTLS